MSSFIVQVNGRTYTAVVDQFREDTVRVKLGDEVFEIDFVAKEEISSLVVRSGREVVRAQTRVMEHNKVDVWVAGIPFPTSILTHALATQSPLPEGLGERRFGGEIRALMPGRVASVLVGAGDRVESGTPLLILEAMKMQNEITSPIAGRVKSVHVKDGSTVKKDALLIEIS